MTFLVWTSTSASNSSSKRAEAAGQHDEALRVLHEHRLAGEEVAEVDADVDPLVHALLEGQLDAEPDRHPAGLAGAAVRGLHRTRAATGDDRIAGRDEQPADLHGQGVLGLGLLHPGRPEHADGRAELGQRAEALDELGLDAQHPPRVGVQPVRRSARVEQPGVGGLGLDLLPAQRHRTLVRLARPAVLRAGRRGAVRGRELECHARQAIRTDRATRSAARRSRAAAAPGRGPAGRTAPHARRRRGRAQQPARPTSRRR